MKEIKITKEEFTKRASKAVSTFLSDVDEKGGPSKTSFLIMLTIIPFIHQLEEELFGEEEFDIDFPNSTFDV